MRLIDADKLLEKYGKYDIGFAVNEMPTVDAIPILEHETNGAMLKRVFPNIVFNMSTNGDRWFEYHGRKIIFTDEWWTKPYKI